MDIQLLMTRSTIFWTASARPSPPVPNSSSSALNDCTQTRKQTFLGGQKWNDACDDGRIADTFFLILPPAPAKPTNILLLLHFLAAVSDERTIVRESSLLFLPPEEKRERHIDNTFACADEQEIYYKTSFVCRKKGRSIRRTESARATINNGGCRETDRQIRQYRNKHGATTDSSAIIVSHQIRRFGKNSSLVKSNDDCIVFRNLPTVITTTATSSPKTATFQWTTSPAECWYRRHWALFRGSIRL